jgi:diguanylate cyclase (GGDEF)-like protein
MMDGKPVRLLIVDDDDDDLYLINDALSEVTETRYEVTAVNSALAAMGKLAANPYDVIISDYRLGYATGIDFIKNVRLAGIDTPIVLLTGLAGHLIDRAALEAGASDFLPKASLSGTVLDRSLRYAMAHADRQRLLHAVLKTTVSGMAVLDAEGALTLWNPRFLEFAGLAFGSDGGRLDRLVEVAMQNGAKDVMVGDRTAEVHCMALPDGGHVLALHDVTERVNELRERALAEQRIRKIAMHDTLTGLPNRMAFNDRLDEALLTAAKEDRRLAILSFDFNRFKEVNDVFGHAAGDELLKMAAERLLPLLTEHEFAARLGGDEFVLVHESPDTGTGIELARRIAEELTMPIEWNGRIIEVGISIGISYFPDHGQRREELLANADLAMYRAKSGMGSSYCVFDAGMDEFIRERRKIAHELRNAIQDGELKLSCQPQYRTSTGELVGFEVLLRWHSKTRGIVAPTDFILIAEETGIIKEIDDWVMRTACRAAAAWSVPTKVAVNVSARAICHPGIIDTVRNILVETGLAPSRLEIEVTETALINDLSRALHNLRQIKASGVSIAMDDFGTGYSSLSLLSSFPFDKIKIDRSFIQAVGQNDRADSIFRAVAGMGKALGVPVLVEGIETEEQLEFARSLGCDEVQGYYCGRPFPEEEIEKLTTSSAGAAAEPQRAPLAAEAAAPNLQAPKKEAAA